MRSRLASPAGSASSPASPSLRSLSASRERARRLAARREPDAARSTTPTRRTGRTTPATPACGSCGASCRSGGKSQRHRREPAPRHRRARRPRVGPDHRRPPRAHRGARLGHRTGTNDDLANKWYLNRGELPPPQGCPGSDGVTARRQRRRPLQRAGLHHRRAATPCPRSRRCATRASASGDVNNNGILDPQDLIAAFSDGKDDDGNGYIDDICGWDFFHNDNDPYDDTGFGHGTGEANDSRAEGNNGSGDIGTCPDCTVQLLRVGDAFVADANDFGMAVDLRRRHRLVGDPGGARHARQHARSRATRSTTPTRTTWSSSPRPPTRTASTTTTRPRNNHTFYVHAITLRHRQHWHTRPPSSTSTTAPNYGAQLMVSMPGGACSSEATGNSAGMAGLIYSAALKANIPPPDGAATPATRTTSAASPPRRCCQILINRLDDLYDPADATDPTKYATRMGWEQRFGYGRVNARTAVDAGVRRAAAARGRDPLAGWFESSTPTRRRW